VVLAALRHARDFFDHASAFAITRSHAQGYDALGTAGARERCRSIRIPLEGPGIFRTVLETRSPFLGPLPADASTDALLASLGRARPRTGFLLPVLIRHRPVAIFLCDNGEAPVSPQRLSDFLLFAGGISGRLEELILDFKRRNQLRDASWRAVEPARAEPPAREQVEVDLTDYEVTAAAQVFQPAPSRETLSLVDQLIESEWGSRQREDVVQRLRALGSEAALALCQRFPGPLEVGRVAYTEAPPVEEHGPILWALVALGADAVQPLLPLLQDADPDRRYYATLVLGRIGDPRSFAELAECVFDPHPKVAYAARGVLTWLRKRADLSLISAHLRAAAADPEPLRAAQAARTLAQLRDVESIPALIALLNRANEALVRSATEALFEITLQQLGPAADRWVAWWEAHRNRPRADWLLGALTHKDRDVRLAAAEELRSAGQPPVDYFADAPPEELQQAANAWASWWSKAGGAL
jgi:hypothetical protein